MPKLAAHEVVDFLDEPGHLARIATVTPDGAPSVAPIWFLFRDGRGVGTAVLPPATDPR